MYRVVLTGLGHPVPSQVPLCQLLRIAAICRSAEKIIIRHCLRVLYRRPKFIPEVFWLSLHSSRVVKSLCIIVNESTVANSKLDCKQENNPMAEKYWNFVWENLSRIVLSFYKQSHNYQYDCQHAKRIGTWRRNHVDHWREFKKIKVLIAYRPSEPTNNTIDKRSVALLYGEWRPAKMVDSVCSDDPRRSVTLRLP